MFQNLVCVIIACILMGLSSCDTDNANYDQLVICHASLFNTNTLQVEKNKTVFINNGFITEIAPTNPSHLLLKSALDAEGRLLTPSFIDVHNHLNFILGDTVEVTDPKKFESARRLLSAQYIPYGVTVVRSAGGREVHLPMKQTWMKHHPDHVDYYPTGGALVSLDTKFYNHTFVSDSAEVVKKINEYHHLGIKHIKVYSLMEASELKAAVETTKELDMTIFGHVENQLISIVAACKLGMSNYEHAKTLFLEVVKEYEKASVDLSHLPPDDQDNWRYREYEIFNFIGAEDPSIKRLIEFLSNHSVSVTPTIHLYAHPIGRTYDDLNLLLHKEDQLPWTQDQFDRAKLGYDQLAGLVYALYVNNIRLNTGSDTYEPGKAILSEMLLLNELGIPMSEVLKIASLNSAQTMGMESHYGSIEVGKKAHLILFDNSPLSDPLNLLSKKTVIKDGVIWNEH